MQKIYKPYIEKECVELHYNYLHPIMNPNGNYYPENWFVAKVGEKGVVFISEHETRGEGDKWLFDITRDDDTVERVFNPHRAFYKMIKN